MLRLNSPMRLQKRAGITSESPGDALGHHTRFMHPVTGRKKRKILYQPLDPCYLWKQVKKVGDTARLDMTTHSLRHTFVQTCHESGASQPGVQRALSHKSGSVARIYLDKLAPSSAKTGSAAQRALEEAPEAAGDVQTPFFEEVHMGGDRWGWRMYTFVSTYMLEVCGIGIPTDYIYKCAKVT